eukprot:TRINITY_DN26628_c0_g1_i1.p1 TRINITY_DN26628_c0_g1~~TRINITY_DN26628_c0_g1_i1.p1  ORF type:complete len:144 (+),score=22.06 TRINITY_DN26628_c0_g1_i1:124-555(+)
MCIRDRRAKFVCDPLYPAQTGECVVSGQLPWNHDVAVFVRDKALASLDDFEQITTASDAEWECVRMREKAIFGKQMPFAGSVGVNRALHPHVPGKSSAFAFRAKDSMKAATILFVCVGDYIKLFLRQWRGCNNAGGQAIACKL